MLCRSAPSPKILILRSERDVTALIPGGAASDAEKKEAPAGSAAPSQTFNEALDRVGIEARENRRGFGKMRSREAHACGRRSMSRICGDQPPLARLGAYRSPLP